MTDENVFEGGITAEAGKVYPYTEITGKLDAVIYKTCADFNKAFPNLKKIGGGLDLSSLTSLDKGVKLPQSIGEGLDLRSLTSLDKGVKLPQSIGGDLDLRSLNDAPKIKPNDSEARNAARTRCRSMLLSSFAAAGFSFADGILARIVSQRGPVSRVIVCGKTEISYIVADELGNYAHGDTLDEARADLMVKRVSKDLTQFKSWTPDKVVSKSDAILAYRSITGACAKGTRLWLERRQTPESLTVYTIIELTRGAYGANVFEKFFEKSAMGAIK
jgi:hypothetical protein